MTNDVDTRIAAALGAISGAASADRDSMLHRILADGNRSATSPKIGPFRPVTLAAGGVVLAAAVIAVAVVTVRDTADAPAATQPSTPTAPTTTTTAPTAPIEQAYVVGVGDSLAAIAEKFCVTFEDLVAENEWTDGTNHAILVGDAIRIPAGDCFAGSGTTAAAGSPSTTAFDPTLFNPDGLESPLAYEVGVGDTASSIAYQLCTTVAALAAWNEWPDALGHTVAEGDVVIVPLGSCIKGSTLTFADPGDTSAATITVIGDSDAARVGAALSASGFTVNDLSKGSSSLARPDFYDWSNSIDDVLAAIPSASPVVMVIGSNDGQALLSSDGVTPALQPETSEWFTEYMARVTTVATKIVTAGHPLVWVGVHGTEVGGFNQSVVNVNDATDYALEVVPGAVYVTAWDVLRGPDGASPSETVIDESGTVVDVFDDQNGATLTDAAISLLTQRVEIALSLTAPANE